jgi:hypothetical protein
LVEINLESIVLADSPEYIKFDALVILFAGFPDPTKTLHGLSALYLDNLNSQYRIYRKFVYGYSNAGQYTQAYIKSWDDTYLYLSAWSNQPPKLASLIKLTMVRSIPYIGSSATQTLAVGENLIENSLSITQQLESVRKLDLRVSTASFEIVGSPDIDTFFGRYWGGRRNGYNYAIGVHIKIDGVGIFWGHLKPENIIYDPEFQIYSIDAFDWVKFILDTKGQNYLPDYPTPNLSEFLTDNMFVFNELLIDVGTTSQIWSQPDYNYIDESNNNDIVSIEHMMTVEDLIIECIKHYGAYMYYDGNKNLVFRNRSIYNALTDNILDDDIIANTFSKAYQSRDYDSLLINIGWDGIDPSQGYVGWLLVWEANGTIESERVLTDLSNLPSTRKYLDIRIAVPYITKAHRLFSSRSVEEVFNDYAYLLYNTYIYNAELARTDLQLNDLVSYGSTEFIIRNIEIIPSEHKSILLMEQKIGN